jgi:hypothetical protein
MGEPYLARTAERTVITIIIVRNYNMPDITMCTGENCPLKETCYRYTADESYEHQSWFMKPPYKDSECEYYWTI